jgi:thiol-disulfide isomerase/thioredoxin
MKLMTRRTTIAAVAGTVAIAAGARNSRAQGLEGPAALKPVDPPRFPPPIKFEDVNGQMHALNEFRGHAIVLNLWATWCVPCVAEMPALAALSRSLAPSDIAVLPLSSDRGGPNVVRGFFDRFEIKGLPILIDPHGEAATALSAEGIPTTIIIDAAGRERARLLGPADWNSPAMLAKISAILRAP